jgi:hypothetical protein
MQLRVAIDVTADADFRELLFRAPYKRRVEEAFVLFAEEFSRAMNGRAHVGTYRIDEVFDLPAAHLGGADAGPATDEETGRHGE